MEWVKTTAKTLPEAIDLALDNLGVDESEAEIVVLEEPRPGLFGRMRGTARVEARVKPKAAPPKNERGRGRGRNRSDGQKGGRNDRNRNRNRNRSGKGSGGQGGQNRDQKKGQQKQGRGQGEGQDQRGRDQKRDGRDRSGGGQNADQGQKGRDRNEKKSGSGRSNTNEQTSKPKEEAPVEEVAAHLESFLSDLTEAFGFDSDVSIDTSEDDVLVGRIEGQHGLLVGPKGRTLDAVQELARISCQRSVPSSIRIKVDVGGYRQQRIEALTAFAGKAADKAVEDGVEVALEPMSPADRKAVHDALSDDDRVETRSVGTEPRRKVLVVPVVDDAADDEESEDTAVADTAAADTATDDAVETNGASVDPAAEDEMVDAGADD